MNSNRVINYKRSYDDLIKGRVFSSLGRYKDSFYINKRKLFFKEENEKVGNELLGDVIASYLGICHTEYDVCTIVTTSREVSGVVSKDYRKSNFLLVKMDKILGSRDMTLDNILDALHIYFSNYNNKDEIVNRIYNGIIDYYMLDLLLGNMDNGRYNYELMVGSDNAYLSPYFDFGMTFNFSSTNLRVDEDSSNNLYDNLGKLLINDDYYNRFISMYNMLTPLCMEKLFDKVEADKGFVLDNNFKNIIFLAYSRHYLMMGNVIENINKRGKRYK